MFWKKDEVDANKPVKANNQDSELQEVVEKRISDGWFRINSYIEIMAVREDITEASLKAHIEKLEKEPGAMIISKKWGDIRKVEKPPRNIKEAYTKFVELDMILKDFPMLLYFVMTYGPAAIEIIRPDIIKLQKGDAQNIVNAVAAMIHQYAAAGVGGIVIAPRKPGSQ